MSGPPVTVVDDGGIPVRAVEDGAPAMTVVESGGMAVTLSEDHGTPFVLVGLNPPTDVPENITPPVISGIPEVGETLTATGGTFSNGPFTRARQWYADAVAISGETSSELLLTEDQEGALITFGVIATNVIGPSDEAFSEAVGPIEGDTPAPVLTHPHDMGLTDSTANLGVTTDTGSGTLYIYVSTSATPPSATDLKAGTGATFADSVAVTSTGMKMFMADLLDPETQYWAYFLHEAGGQDSNIANYPFETQSDEGYVIPTPVVEQVSDDGDPLAWKIVDPGYGIDHYLQIQMASDAAFTEPLGSEIEIRDGYRLLEWLDFTDDDDDGIVEMQPFDWLQDLPGGPTYLRLRYGVEADDGLSIIWGNWSNTINDDVVVEAPSTFDPLQKSSWTTLSNGNLTITSNVVNVGAHAGSRSTHSRAGRRAFTVTIDQQDRDGIMVGVANSSHVFSSGTIGTTANTSYYRTNLPGTAVISSAGSANNGYANAAQGDVITCLFDTALGKVWWAVNGTWVSGDPTTDTGGANLPEGATLYAFAAVMPKNTPNNPMAVTINFSPASPPAGAGAFV